MYNRSMKSSIAAFKYGARKEYGRYYAVELAKKYGEDKSKNFVNGVLASIVKDM